MPLEWTACLLNTQVNLITIEIRQGNLMDVDRGAEHKQYGSDWPAGTVITMYGETYRIRRNFGTSGEVEYVDGGLATTNFYWIFQGDKAELVCLPEKHITN